MIFRTPSGAGLHYKTRGSGRTIVLLHPVGVCADFWDGVISALEGEFRLIAMDARGHGGSDVPSQPFGLDDLADDVASLVRSVGQGPTVAVGCSMGGMVAQALVARHPDCLRGAVVANTAHRRNDAGRAAMDQRAAAAEGGMPGTIKTTLSRWFDADMQVLRPDLVLQARDWLLSADPVVHAWSWRAIRDLDYAQALAQTRVPCMVVAGLRDQSTPVAAMKDMAASIPACVYREMDTGHLAPLEQPEAFADHIRSFVNSLA
jgi:3-oxoadipate enol-lactonase